MGSRIPGKEIRAGFRVPGSQGYVLKTPKD
jgi:hypothetical protein